MLSKVLFGGFRMLSEVLFVVFSYVSHCFFCRFDLFIDVLCRFFYVFRSSLCGLS